MSTSTSSIESHHALLCTALGKISGLEAPTVRVEESDNLDQKSLWLLFQARLLTWQDTGFSEEQKQGMLHEFRAQPGKLPEYPHPLDLLGSYKPNGNNASGSKIVLFTETIWRVARSLDVPYFVLKQKVLAHETAHAVTHLGRDRMGKVWENFGDAPTGQREFFAQIYSHLLFRAAAEKGAHLGGYRAVMTGEIGQSWSQELYDIALYPNTMTRLMHNQPWRYKTWFPFRDQRAEFINNLLEHARS